MPVRGIVMPTRLRSLAEFAEPIWPEGMLPSSVNDSVRAMMELIKKYRDDPYSVLVTINPSPRPIADESV
jgi:hypothetical protein